MFWYIRRWLKDETIKKIYLDVARQLGDALSYSYMGKCVGFDSIVAAEAMWTTELIQRGYLPLTYDEMVAYGGYGQDVTLKRINKGD